MSSSPLSPGATTHAPAAVDQLRAVWQRRDPWDYDPATLGPLQLTALRARFDERYHQLRVLKQRADDLQVKKIDALHDIVPLLFSHTNYKSYSPTFAGKGRWDLMTRWLSNLSTRPVDNVDLSSISDIDDWVAAMRAAGHFVLCSSGTTGQSSFVNYAPADRAMQKLTIAKAFEVSAGQLPDNKFQSFFAGPRMGPTMAADQMMLTAELFAAPSGAHYISERANSIVELDRMAALRRAMAAGTATPDLIKSAEAEARIRAAEMNEQLNALIDKILTHRKQPILLFLIPAMLLRLLNHARSQGVTGGDFHPATLVRSGGGRKGVDLPENFDGEIDAFFGFSKTRWVDTYGMTELSSQFIKCSAGRFHCPPTVIPLILNKQGTALVERKGDIIEGRGGYFDLSLEGFWGGIVTGDRLTFDFGGCPCGRISPSIIEVTRYSDLPEGEDKLTCAGTIDTYIRGFTNDGGST